MDKIERRAWRSRIGKLTPGQRYRVTVENGLTGDPPDVFVSEFVKAAVWLGRTMEWPYLVFSDREVALSRVVEVVPEPREAEAKE